MKRKNPDQQNLDLQLPKQESLDVEQRRLFFEFDTDSDIELKFGQSKTSGYCIIPVKDGFGVIKKIQAEIFDDKISVADEDLLNPKFVKEFKEFVWKEFKLMANQMSPNKAYHYNPWKEKLPGIKKYREDD